MGIASPEASIMEFTQGQLVVYPAYGVGIVDKISSQDIGGKRINLYIVRILGNNVTLMVPVHNVQHVGLRHLSSPEYCRKILESFKDRSGFSGYTGQNWNRRYREYSDKLKTGALTDCRDVLKELLLISGEKELSFGERRLLEQSMNFIAAEIAYVLQDQQESVQNDIRAMFEDILPPRKKTEKTLVNVPDME
jgi:CarD family transcriptional regulator